MDTRGIADLTPVELNKHAQQLGNTPMEAIYLVIEGVTRKVQLKLESENLDWIGERPDRLRSDTGIGSPGPSVP